MKNIWLALRVSPDKGDKLPPSGLSSAKSSFHDPVHPAAFVTVTRNRAVISYRLPDSIDRRGACSAQVNDRAPLSVVEDCKTIIYAILDREHVQPLRRLLLGPEVQSMCDHDEPWRLYRLNWFSLSVLAILLCISIVASSFSIELESGLRKDVLTASALVLAGHLLISYGWGARPGFAIIAMAQIRILAMLATPLTYIAASANLPLQDFNPRILGSTLGTGLGCLLPVRHWPTNARPICVCFLCTHRLVCNRRSGHSWAHPELRSPAAIHVGMHTHLLCHGHHLHVHSGLRHISPVRATNRILRI